ncbi:hypothetical protein [Pseudomonas nicosulfuronedens]
MKANSDPGLGELQRGVSERKEQGFSQRLSQVRQSLKTGAASHG